MKTKSLSPVSQLLGRIHAVWSEMDYAQRRSFEIRTGIPAHDVLQRRRTRRTIKELEAPCRPDERPIAS